MGCDTSTDSGSHDSFEAGLGIAIAFDEIGANDKLLIKTRNSEYRFEIADPVSHKGMLSGGALGEKPREAFLIESSGRCDATGNPAFQGLTAGARALFYLSAGSRLERVITSQISSLTLVRSKDRPSLID